MIDYLQNQMEVVSRCLESVKEEAEDGKIEINRQLKRIVITDQLQNHMESESKLPESVEEEVLDYEKIRDKMHLKVHHKNFNVLHPRDL